MTIPSVARTESARKLAARLKKQWRKAGAADAAAALAEHPELRRHTSVAVDLLYNEYLLSEDAGAAPEAESFVARFPTFRARLLSVLAVHKLLTNQPELLPPEFVPPDAAWPVLGTLVRGLRLEAVLGKGGFGRAYLAFDTRLHRLRVLKLTPGWSGEARVIGGLKHPNVTDVCWADEVDGRTAVCMPLVGVSTLADVIGAAHRPAAPPPDTADVILTVAEADDLAADADRPAPPAVFAGESFAVGACSLAARVAEAVAYLHSMGVAHGDLKPSNIVVGLGGTPYLIDFNLAMRDAGPAAVRGTPGYMAPELLDAAAAGPLAAAVNFLRADLFALGVVVFELLTGRRPFGVPDPSDFAAQAVAAREPLPAFPPSVPEAVASVLAACLSPEPAARPASAAALAEALDRFVTDARTPPAFAAPARQFSRRRATVAAVGFVLAATVGGAFWAGWSRPGAGVASREVIAAPAAVGLVPDRRRPPQTAEEFFDRGWLAMKGEDWRGATDDFVRSDKLAKNPWALSLAAYCESVNWANVAAAGRTQALVNQGTATPDVLNNLGYALLQLGKPKEALAVLDRGLALDPQHAAASFNRAFARLKLANNGQPVDPGAAEDVRVAVTSAELTSDGHFTAAQVLSECAQLQTKHRTAARYHVRAAIAAGKPASDCRSDATLRLRLASGFGAALMFEAACSAPQGTGTPTPRPFRLVEPRPF